MHQETRGSDPSRARRTGCSGSSVVTLKLATDTGADFLSVVVVEKSSAVIASYYFLYE